MPGEFFELRVVFCKLCPRDKYRGHNRNSNLLILQPTKRRVGGEAPNIENEDVICAAWSRLSHDSSGDDRRARGTGVMISRGKREKLGNKPVPVPLRSAMNLAWSHPGLNPRLRGEKPTPNLLSYQETGLREASFRRAPIDSNTPVKLCSPPAPEVNLLGYYN
jgi:hypothetical protein